MCGITGFWNTSSQYSSEQLQTIVEQMSNLLEHRGPDDQGNWVDPESGIALGHRRLAIVDLSQEGHQPMKSADGRYLIVFNGEIYNFLELRKQLENLGHHFRGSSDTEVMLAGFREWGVHSAVEHFNGMFAFALWDRLERTLHLGRDRLGEKPLYYGWVNGNFLFSSELKAFKAHPAFNTEIDRDTVALFFRHGYIPAPYSIYQDIYKLIPGTILTWDGTTTEPEPVPYWSAKKAAELGKTQPFLTDEREVVNQLEKLLLDAVAIRTIADVPLGAFLSGGIDSSTIVALMQAQTSQSVKTFTIGFHENEYNEATYAQAIAKHLGTEHTELYVTPEETLAVIPKLPTLYDEPFADVSQIPTFLLSQLTRQYVTVSLSGDGGDELFAGYNHYFLTRDIWQKTGWIPAKQRYALAGLLTSVPPKTWNTALSNFSNWLPTRLKQKSPGDQIYKLAEVLTVPNSQAMYQRLTSHWKEPESIVLNSSQLSAGIVNPENWANFSNLIENMSYLDLVTYLPDDILVKVDRASMGVSLETRIPLLDHRLVEFAFRIPMTMNVRNGKGKNLLRQVLDKYVPQHLLERPKMGFSTPIDSWLRNPLRDWAESLLNANRLDQEGFLNSQIIQKKWSEHLSGDCNWHNHLWDVLMFQSWLENNV